MNYPHADHSVCAIQGFIYVVGTFVNNKVYGQCEQYDTQKDKWKVIDEMRVPRTGVSLCAFKNNYMFAFGGLLTRRKLSIQLSVTTSVGMFGRRYPLACVIKLNGFL